MIYSHTVFKLTLAENAVFLGYGGIMLEEIRAGGTMFGSLVVCLNLIGSFISGLYLLWVLIFPEDYDGDGGVPRRRMFTASIGTVLYAAVTWGGLLVNYYTTHFGSTYFAALVFTVVGVGIMVATIRAVKRQK